MEKIFTIKGALSEARAVIKPKLWSVVRQYAAMVAIFGLLSGFAGDNLLLSIIVSAMGAFTMALFSLGYAKRGTYGLREFMKALTFQAFAYFFLAYMVSKVFVILGFVALIIPGIMLSVWLCFVNLIASEKEIGPWEACKESARLTSGYRWKLLGFFIVMILINLLGLLCLIVGLFYTIPLTLIATALVYRKLYDAKDFVPDIVEIIETDIEIVEMPTGEGSTETSA